MECLYAGREPRLCRKAFLIALITAVVIFIPFVIWDKGYFFFFGDFNVQQVPFYKLAHEAVRSGNIFWNWKTDLGVNFIGSYSFYLIGSPFFWLTLPFPTEFVPHLMAPLLILKHACAAFTACLYLKRFVKHGEYAIFGGLLYAFSGFAVYNIFFNHFHEAIVFFPLLLVGLEELMTHNRRGMFALAVAVNAFVNYWFFIGEAVFVILYFCFRYSSPAWKGSVKKFFLVGLEAFLGFLMAMCLFLPSVLAILGNPRTGSSELLSGWNLWLYWHNQLYPAIISSTLFPPDLPSRPNLFPDRGAKWASLSAWLPLIGMSGVVAYFMSRRDWLRKLMVTCAVIALVPCLNSMFILFNNSYYARWFYMPILLMALCSARALESPSIRLKKGFLLTAFVTMMLTVILAISPMEKDGKQVLGLTKYPAVFAAVSAIALLGLAAFWLIVRKTRGEKRYMRALTGALCVTSVVYSITFIALGKGHSDDTAFIRETALAGRYQLELDDSQFARSDLYDSMDNLGMFWGLPNLQTFHSIIPVSTMEFYPKVGVKRDVSSKPETKYYHLRSLLSTRWFFVKEDEIEQELMPGYSLESVQLGYNVYRNDYFIPMGFTFEDYITVRDFEQVPEEKRASVLLRALVIKEETEATSKGLMRHLAPEDYLNLTEADYYSQCDRLAETAASSFETNRSGFVSKITLPQENLVFYSVPHDRGWSATVNGEPVEVEKVDIGFMAVRAPAGENIIEFTYRTPGLFLGILVSGGGLLLLLVYLFLCRRQGVKFARGGFDDAYAAEQDYVRQAPRRRPHVASNLPEENPPGKPLPNSESVSGALDVFSVQDCDEQEFYELFQSRTPEEPGGDKTEVESGEEPPLPPEWFDESEENDLK